MAKIKLTLTEDHLKLISNFHFQKMKKYNDSVMYPTMQLDLNNLYGGTYLFEDIAYILGRYDEHISGTEDNVMGPEFENDFTNYMYQLHMDIMNNLDNIEELVHTYINKGGLTVGTYQCDSFSRIWEKID